MVNPVERFLNYLTVEKGLSVNTIEAYRNDIKKFQRYLKNISKEITDFDRSDIISYINNLRDSGNQNTTISRNISAARGLCNFLLAENLTKNDPLENLSNPKGWKNLPRTLPLDDVISLLEKPKGKKLSLRDKVILELSTHQA